MEVYPLLACVGVGCSLSVYAMGHHLMANPDVNVKTTDYSWERFGPNHRTHFDWLEGKARNDREQAFYKSHVAHKA